ncbi:hypothetical protein [Tissierella praeacuta]|uniref:hypothetical protein n=1 Tax=Tissierella praeacuta TaxID=43131 RepID=UPI003342CF9D
MKKKYMYGTVITLIMLTIMSSIVYASNTINGKGIAKQVKNLFIEQLEKDDDILCYVNGIEISQKKFDIFRETRKSYNGDKDDDTLLKEYIQFILIVNEAEEEGFTVSESEVEDYTNDLFESLEEDDDENMKILKEYVKEMNITMDQYKEQVRDYNYKILSTMKLQEKLVSKYMEENINIMHSRSNNEEDIQTDINEFLKDYKENLYNNAEIIMNK